MIFRYANWTCPSKKMQISFYFLLPPDSAISLELRVPQKWFKISRISWGKQSEKFQMSDSKNKNTNLGPTKKINPIFYFYFISPSPRLLQKGSRLGPSNEKSSNHGLYWLQDTPILLPTNTCGAQSTRDQSLKERVQNTRLERPGEWRHRKVQGPQIMMHWRIRVENPARHLVWSCRLSGTSRKVNHW